ncbi:MAG: molybdenum cofactor biosynthesis protein MoaE [Nitratiruptor sp.]|nr:molybdenum cofactor biosynthesis protein MoaE [Nitratiruptor sp.]NPA83836.1 molybdenum cofactor biosynthesis protein MoaE [Campylobacterota bacterium]
MLEIYPGELEVEAIFSRWYAWGAKRNFGAWVTFVGTVRAEGGIEALSFDIYEPLLRSWFDGWQQRAQEVGAVVRMAHSRGNVPVHTSSYMAAVFSPRRRVALELLEAFVEDFKANAPIWKYDVRNGERIYAKDRSQPLAGSGLLDL